MSAWNPIETAPKDGTRILVRGVHGPWPAHWDGERWISYSLEYPSPTEWTSALDEFGKWRASHCCWGKSKF